MRHWQKYLKKLTVQLKRERKSIDYFDKILKYSRTIEDLRFYIMGVVKVAGSVLVLAGGVLSLLIPIELLFGWFGLFDLLLLGFTYGLIVASIGEFYIYFGLILAILTILGGIIGFRKKAGGGIALVVGAIMILGGFVNAPLLFPMSAMLLWTGQFFVGPGVLTIEAILIVVGGILCLAGGD